MHDPKQRTVAVTRPVGRGADTAETIRKLGWTPLIFHTVELKPLDQRKIQNQVESLLSHGLVDWIVFMSSTGVKLFFDNLTLQNRERLLAPNQCHFLAVGPRTRDSLVHYGITSSHVPDAYSSAGVDEWFAGIEEEHLHVMLFRSSSADDSLSLSLQSRGATVTTVNLYESAVPGDTRSVSKFLSSLEAAEIDSVLFTSAISVSNLFKIVGAKSKENSLIEHLKQVRVGAIGPATAQELRKWGIESVVPAEYLIENALEKLTRAVRVTPEQPGARETA